MEKSRLLKLLRTLSPEELRGLKKFVHTPFFNQRTEVTALLDLLEKSLKKNSPAPEKREVFAHLFGKADYDDHRIRMAMSFLYQIAGQFLTVSEFLADKQQYHIRLANIFRKRQLPDAFTGAWQEADKAQYDKPYRNADFFEERYRMLLEKYRFEVETQSTEHLDFQELSDQLDSAFLARKLWQACFMHSHQTVRNSAYYFGLLDAALHHASAEGFEALTIGVLADKIGMSKSGLFAHFGSKEDLQIATLDEAARRFNEVAVIPALSEPRGLVRLRALFNLWVEWTARCNLESCPMMTATIEFDDRPGPVREAASRCCVADAPTPMVT